MYAMDMLLCTAESQMNSLAGAGTVTLEFSTLSALTNDSKYAVAADRAVKVLYTHRNNRELFGRYINVTSGHWILEDAAGIGHCTDRYIIHVQSVKLCDVHAVLLTVQCW